MTEISRTCGGGNSGRPLVAGVLRGYRTWRLRNRFARTEPGTLPLTSVAHRQVQWAPTLTASCVAHDDSLLGPLVSTALLAGPHRSPAAGCLCGIYAWYAPRDTDILRARVFGVVEASGLILLGTRGFRAERARIAAVVTRNRRLQHACELAGIATYHRRRDLVRDFPPEDVSTLLVPEPARA